MQIAMIQDRIIPLDELDPRYLDRGTFFGDGVYEVLRSYEGHLFALEKHLDRFSRSLREVDITGVEIDDIRQRVLTAFDRASIVNAKVYFHITRGSEQRNHAGNPDTKPNFFLTISELVDNPAEKEAGIAVSTFPDWRWKRCDIKSLNLLANVLARRDAEKKRCCEAILVNDAGEITEGASSSFFMVCGGAKELVTRPLGEDILPSITRGVVEQLSVNTGLTVVERGIGVDEAKVADELFIAVTTQDIVGVVEFDGVKIGDGRPGKYTKLLMEEFKKHILVM